MFDPSAPKRGVPSRLQPFDDITVFLPTRSPSIIVPLFPAGRWLFRWSPDVISSPFPTFFNQRYDIRKTYGGIWGRPDTDEGGDPFGGDRTGGLTVLNEASPLAFIIEEAGGRAVDGHGRRVLDIHPETLRQKTGLLMGSEDDILELERALEGSD